MFCPELFLFIAMFFILEMKCLKHDLQDYALQARNHANQGSDNFTCNMKKTLTHLPKNKKAELEKITDTIREFCDDVEMIILFGSYARGDWKEESELRRVKIEV